MTKPFADLYRERMKGATKKERRPYAEPQEDPPFACKDLEDTRCCSSKESCIYKHGRTCSAADR